MDGGGNVLVTHQGERTVAAFDATFQRLQRLFDLREKARNGDAAAEIEVALLEGDLEILAYGEVQKRIDGKKLSDAQTEMLKDLELGAMITEVGNSTDQETGLAAAKKLADAYAAGRVPVAKGRKQPFFFILLQYAHSQKDAVLAQKALDAVKPILKEEMGDDPRLSSWIQKQQDGIDELRAQKEEGCGEDDEGIEEGCGEGGK